MDKNQVTGLLLISLMVMVYFYWLAPQQTPVQETADGPVTTLPEGKEYPGEKEETVVSTKEDSVAQEGLRQRMGIFADKTQGTEEEAVLENEDIKITFNNKGGTVKNVLLKKYLTYDKKPLYLFETHSNQLGLLLNTQRGQVDLSDLYFEAKKGTEVVEEETLNSLTYSISLGNGKSITQVYALPEKGYQLDYNLDIAGLGNDLTNDHVQLYWIDQIKNVERSLQETRNKTTINYYLVGDEFDNLSETSTDKELEEIIQPLKWVSIKQKFFTSAIIGRDAYFRNGVVSTELDPNDTSVVKVAEMMLNIPLETLQGNKGRFTYYFGPNNYQILKKVTPGFSRNVDLGWGIFSWFNKFLVIPIFNFLENYIANYGIIIIILVLIIKILLSPLSYKSYLSMAKTKVLKPELDAIKEKHDGDMQKIQADQMQLYQKVGINPLSGCIPMLLQLPILLALFNFFPNSIELRQEGFLWADDLSTYDSIYSWSGNIPLLSSFYGNHISLFTLLMTVSTIITTKFNSQMTTVQGPMKTMQYMMPIMFLFFLNSYSSGLTLYYFIANIITLVQQLIIRKFVDEDKIRAVLEENKKKNVNKKKSKFQQRLEDAMKTSEELKKAKKK